MSKLEAELDAERTMSNASPGSFAAQLLNTLTGADVEVAKRDLGALVAERDRLAQDLTDCHTELGKAYGEIEELTATVQRMSDLVHKEAMRVEITLAANQAEAERYREALEKLMPRPKGGLWDLPCGGANQAEVIMKALAAQSPPAVFKVETAAQPPAQGPDEGDSCEA